MFWGRKRDENREKRKEKIEKRTLLRKSFEGRRRGEKRFDMRY
jgi:hypothetical protein